MEENERLDLLNAVASCAPKEMNAEYWCPEPFLQVSSDGSGVWVPRTEYADVRFRLDFYKEHTCLALQGDVEDGSAIIAMLDVMEKAGFYCMVWNDCDPVRLGLPVANRYVASVADENGFDLILNGEVCAEGATRAEAVARAFVAVFGEKQ